MSQNSTWKPRDLAIIPRSPDAVAYGNFTRKFTSTLASELAGRKVLEVFAGNGLLASIMHDHGTDWTATSLFMGHDGHDMGMFHPVVEMEALAAVMSLGRDMDVLFMSWPTTTEHARRAVQEWGRTYGKPVFYVGEMPRPGLGEMGMYPGCASDRFFQVTQVVRPLPGYQPRNAMDRAVELRVIG